MTLTQAEALKTAIWNAGLGSLTGGGEVGPYEAMSVLKELNDLGFVVMPKEQQEASDDYIRVVERFLRGTQ